MDTTTPVLPRSRMRKSIAPSAPLMSSRESLLEDSINLDVLVKLKKIFEDADERGGGDLDISEFTKAFKSIPGSQMSDNELRSMFMKIDVNSDGSVDWDEFSTFMLLGYHGAAKMQENESYVPYTENPSPSLSQQPHSEMITKLLVHPQLDRWYTCSRDGVVRSWNSSLHSVIREAQVTRNNWITDMAIHTPHRAQGEKGKGGGGGGNALSGENDKAVPVAWKNKSQRIAVSHFGRRISFLDMNSLETCGEIKGLPWAPLSIDCFQSYKTNRAYLTCGDDGGYVSLYELNDDRVGATSIDLRGLTPVTSTRRWRLKVHSDWTTKVKYLSDLNTIVSCSMDSRVCLTDMDKRIISHTLNGHTKGVRAMDWSKVYKIIGTAGLDRYAMLSSPFGSKPIALLPNHSASLESIVINDLNHQVITLCSDKTVRIWDIRNYKCLQVLTYREACRPENRLSTLSIDPANKTVLCCSSSIVTWVPVNQARGFLSMEHKHPIAAALYNPTFHQIVSGDTCGNISVWDLNTGRLNFRFGTGDEKSKRNAPRYSHQVGNEQGSLAAELEKQFDQKNKGRITAMCFDDHWRRLITANRKGRICVWNANNGALLKEFETGCKQEVTELEYIRGGYLSKYVMAVGWDRNVTFWDDSADAPITATGTANGNAVSAGSGAILPCRRLPGHRDDILALAVKRPATIATASYDGQILIWNIDSGSITTKIDITRLMSKPRIQQKPSHFQPTSAFSRDSDPDPDSPISRPVEALLFLKGHSDTLLSGDADGFMRFWNVFSGDLVLEHSPHHLLNEAIVALCSSAPDDALIFSADSKGYVQAWSMVASSEGNNSSSSNNSASQAHRSNGEHAIDNQRSAATPRSQRKSFDFALVRSASWRAHDSRISGLEHIELQSLLLSAGEDKSVKLWSSSGALVGVFGLHEWVIGNRTTWQSRSAQSVDMDALYREKIAEELQRIKEQEKQEKGNQESAADRRMANAVNAVAGQRYNSAQIEVLRDKILARRNNRGVVSSSSSSGEHPPPSSSTSRQRKVGWTANSTHHHPKKGLNARVRIPTDLDKVNYPYTPGRSADAVSHLIFIRDIVDTSGVRSAFHSQATSSNGGGTRKKEAAGAGARPHTAPAANNAGSQNRDRDRVFGNAAIRKSGEQDWRRKLAQTR